jgi:hypothetical protein
LKAARAAIEESDYIVRQVADTMVVPTEVRSTGTVVVVVVLKDRD